MARDPIPSGVPEEPGVLESLLARAIGERGGPALDALMTLLATKHYRRIAAYVRLIPGARTSTREDAIQDSFIRFIERVREGRLEEVPESVLNYVQRLATYTLRDRVKLKDHRARKVPTQMEHAFPDGKIRGPSTEVGIEEHRKALTEALSGLAPGKREILEKVQEGMSYREIARAVGKSEEAARKIYKRAQGEILQALALRSRTLAGKFKCMVVDRQKPKTSPPSPETLRAAVDALPPEFREILHALHYEGRTLEKVAGTLGEEKTRARRDAGYQLLARHFNVRFPDAFEAMGS